MTPRNPYLVLVAAILLPGSGHVWLGLAQRGLLFLFFMIMLGWASVNIMPPSGTFIGRHIGGLFIYGLSIIDAYKIARVRLSEWNHAQNTSADH
jgi:membrane associated rhomboid family serine protease